MLAQRDLVLPLWNGSVVPSKPPLFHWLVVLGAWASGEGVTPRTLRAPSVVLGAAVVLLVLAAGTAWGGREVGVLAALVLATTPQLLDEASTGRVDMTLAAAVTAAQVAVVQAVGEGARRRAAVLAALGAALAMLAKGPVGPGLVALAALAFAARQRRPALLRPLLRPFPMLVFLVVAGTWYGLATLHRGEAFFAKQIISENGEALLGGERVPSRPPLFYLPRLVLGGLPWTLCLPWAVARAWSGAPARRYCLGWAAAGFLFFSLVPLKRGAYLLPLRPALALLLGWWLAERVRAGSVEGRAFRPLAGAALVVALALGAGVGAAVAILHGALPAAALSRAVPDVDAGRVLELVRAHERELVVLGLSGAAAAVVLAGALRRRDAWTAVLGTAAVTACLALVAQGVVAPVRATLASVRPFALDVRVRVAPGERLALLTASEEMPFLFYVGRDVPVLGPAGRRPRDLPPGHYVLPQARWDGWGGPAGWEEVVCGPDLASRHRTDLVLVRRR
jgi:4-amino-4-deoxy-L-arabinose transferase-like glycosyltransferase